MPLVGVNRLLRLSYSTTAAGAEILMFTESSRPRLGRGIAQLRLDLRVDVSCADGPRRFRRELPASLQHRQRHVQLVADRLVERPAGVSKTVEVEVQPAGAHGHE